MNHRGFAQGSFFCTLAAVILAGYQSAAQAQLTTQDAVKRVSLNDELYPENFDLTSGRDLSYKGDPDPDVVYEDEIYSENSCCAEACCEDCCDGCGSWITARLGALYMKREAVDNVPIVFHNGGDVALSGGSFDFDYEFGFDTSIIVDNGYLPAPLEFRYFRISDWTSNHGPTALTNGSVNTNPNFGGFYSTMDYARYLSRLESFELLFRKEVSCRLTLTAGFRYVSFDEDLDTLFDAGEQFWWGIENDLYGFQLGAEYVLYDNCCGFRIEAFGKAGIYGNDAKVATQVQAIEQAAVSERNGMDHVSFLGELGLMGAYDLSCCWTVRAGYQVMWLDGVLVAANQVPVTDNNAVTLDYDYTDVIFHGAKVELERRW